MSLTNGDVNIIREICKSEETRQAILNARLWPNVPEKLETVRDVLRMIADAHREPSVPPPVPPTEPLVAP